MTKADRAKARFLAHCSRRDRIREQLADVHRKIAALTDRENVLMADLHNVNHAIDELLEQKRTG
jgi:hypothetical protein